MAFLEPFGDGGTSAGDVLDIVQRRNSLISSDVISKCGHATRTLNVHQRDSSSPLKRTLLKLRGRPMECSVIRRLWISLRSQFAWDSVLLRIWV